MSQGQQNPCVVCTCTVIQKYLEKKCALYNTNRYIIMVSNFFALGAFRHQYTSCVLFWLANFFLYLAVKYSSSFFIPGNGTCKVTVSSIPIITTSFPSLSPHHFMRVVSNLLQGRSEGSNVVYHLWCAFDLVCVSLVVNNTYPDLK